MSMTSITKRVREVMAVLLSLVASAVTHFLPMVLAMIALDIATRKKADVVAMLIGGVLFPFALAGVVVAFVKGFRFPCLMAPLGAALALCGPFVAILLMEGRIDPPLDPRLCIYLSGIPVSWASCWCCRRAIEYGDKGKRCI